MDDAMAPNVGRVMRARAHLPSGGRRSGAMPTEAACAARALVATVLGAGLVRARSGREGGRASESCARESDVTSR
jgi:hypothetical protein